MNTEILLLYCRDRGGTEGDKWNRTPSLDLERARGWGELSDGADSRGELRWLPALSDDNDDDDDVRE